MSSTVHAGSAPELLSLSPVPAPSSPVLVLDDRGGPPRVPASGTAETTVVVVRSEHGPCTTATLAALRSQTHPPDRVAVVVTGGAEADTADVAAARRAGVPVLGSRGGATGDAVRAGLAALDDDRPPAAADRRP